MFKSVRNQNLQSLLSNFSSELRNRSRIILYFSITIKQSAPIHKALTSESKASVKAVSHPDLEGKQKHFGHEVNITED